jgi:hypothetical protein
MRRALAIVAVLIAASAASVCLAGVAPENVMAPPPPYPYVYVLADGSARELHENERRYLETEFSGGDGAAPYIKGSYEERNGWGEIKGYLERARLPRGTLIHPAPSEDPSKPMNREEYIAYLRSKGLEVIENDDGSFTTRTKR